MPFQKGHSGFKKPGTKHKKTIEAEAAQLYIKERVSAELGAIMDRAIMQAKKGDNNTRKDLFDRAYGKARETVDHRVSFIFDDAEDQVE